MNFPQRTSTLAQPAPPAVTIVEINDPVAVGQGIHVLGMDAVQLQTKPLQARQIMVRLDRTLLVYHSTNLPIRSRTSLCSGLIAFTTYGPQAAGTVNGLPLGPTRLLASPAGIELEFVVAAGFECVDFCVPPDVLLARLQGRHCKCRSVIFSVPQRLQIDAAAAAALFQWGLRVIQTAARQPDLFDVAQARSAVEDELIETLLDKFDLAVEADVGPCDRTRASHYRVVKTAEDYALAHPDERLYVTNLCQAAAVSVRTLENAFKEIMGLTPVAYLTRLRLHRVRKSLRSATRGSTTVSREALRWGFWHFGEFSRAYKECFGELPSQTLRRK